MKTLKRTFFIGLFIILAIDFIALFGIGSIKGANEMRFGIDIRGGVDATFEPVGLDRKPTSSEMQSARSIIESRLDANNILDREVTIDKKDGNIIVRFPWKSDEKDFNPEKAIAELGETAELTFRDSNNKVLLKGDEVKHSEAAKDPQTNEAVVSLEFTQKGAGKFSKATKDLIGKPISIYMDDTLLSAPIVNSQITDGKAIITGMANHEEAKALSDKINSGSLPFSMTTTNHSSISPTLGNGALHVMVKAGIIAFFIICIFMISYYRLAGFVSCIALTLQLACQLLFLSIPQFTLTLPGIAGIILSLGMGVDANIIISARISEELRSGCSIQKAIKEGYKNAFSSVFDGNITSAIVAIILMIFGSGSMLSFGYTLLTGIIMNFVAGIFTTKKLLTSLVSFPRMNKITFFHTSKEHKTLPFYRKRWAPFVFSIVLICIGFLSFFTNGIKLDTQFVGGTILKFTYSGTLDTTDFSRIADETIHRTANVQTNQDLATNQSKVVLTLAGNSGITPVEQASLTKALSDFAPEANLKLSESYMVEPYIGQQALQNSIFAIILSSIFIVIYVWFRFKSMSGLSAGVMAVLALVHDVFMVLLVFTLFKIPLNDAFVAVTLTIIGYSINDTIVTYDRIRENKIKQPKLPVADLVELSITQTLSRSINTAFTTTICMLSIFIFSSLYGIQSIVVFSLPMLIGLVFGCYSSVCIAGPLWACWQKRKLSKI